MSPEGNRTHLNHGVNQIPRWQKVCNCCDIVDAFNLTLLICISFTAFILSGKSVSFKIPTP